jgi:hypothetical protein
MKKLVVLTFVAAAAGAYLAQRLFEVNPLYWQKFKRTPDSVPEQFVWNARQRGWL